MRFFVPTDLRIGANIVRQSAASFAELGKRCLILTGAHSAKALQSITMMTAIIMIRFLFSLIFIFYS